MNAFIIIIYALEQYYYKWYIFPKKLKTVMKIWHTVVSMYLENEYSTSNEVTF